MHSLSMFTIAGLTLFALAACNSTSPDIPNGTVCPATYDPVPMSVSGTQKAVPTDPQQNKTSASDSQMPPGVYTYSLADLMFAQKGIKDPIVAHVHDQAAKQSVVCLGNAKMKMQVPQVEMDAVTDVVVCHNFNQIVKTRHYTFDITNGTINFPAPQPKDYCLTSSAQVSKDPQMFIRDDAFNYQWRMSHDDTAAQWIMSVRMLWSPYPNNVEPPECTQCVPPANPAPAAKSNPVRSQRRPQPTAHPNTTGH